MDFTAGAHDLRTALTVMLGHMRLLAIERLSDTGRHRLEVLELLSCPEHHQRGETLWQLRRQERDSRRRCVS